MGRVDTERKRSERYSRYERLANGETILHGRMSSYNNWGCRCGLCTEAYMLWKSLYDIQRKPSRKQLPPDLSVLANEMSEELAKLIQDQYDDDKARRVGFGKRVPGLSYD